MRTPSAPDTTATRTVHVVDADHQISELVEMLLTDVGYRVSCLFYTPGELFQETVGRIEPDCVLLDSTPGEHGYSHAWQFAQYLNTRERPVPVILFTVDAALVQEAQAHASPRS